MERKLAAIFSADVQGYSRLMGDDEETTIRTLTAYREVMTALIRQHRGRVVDSPGDNLLAEFASAVDAVQGAVAIQKELKTRNAELPDQRKMQYRIGINVGDVVVEGERIYGDGVNIAARLESLAEGGGICISGNVHEQVKNKLTLSYDYRGEQRVKNIAEPVRVYKVEWEAQAVAPTTSREPAVELPLPDKPSIAVLPFTNMSADPEQEYFSDGITEDLITDFSKLSGLFVIARNSAFAYKGKTVKVQEVRRELGVQYILEGSVRKAEGQVRITAQLVDTTTGYHVWAERYDRELKGIFALQDEVTQKIVAALEVKLTVGEQGRVWRRYTENVEAYDFFLRGMEYHNRLTLEANVQARQLFEKALTLDPQFAAAYASLGWTYLREWGWQQSQDPQTLDRAFALAQKAIALDDSLPLAHRVLGNVYKWQKQHEQAIAEAERAIVLDPNSADGYEELASTLNWMGRYAEAIKLIEKAMRLNPHHPPWYLFKLGWAYAMTGRVEEAIAACKRVLTRSPDFLSAHVFLAAIYSQLGREAEARTEAAEVLQLSPNLSLEVWKQTLPVKDQAGLERFVALLRKAGLK